MIILFITFDKSYIYPNNMENKLYKNREVGRFDNLYLYLTRVYKEKLT